MDGPLPSGSGSSMFDDRDRHAEDPFDLPSELVLPLPPGEYTLLPIIDLCDNCELPRGPWDARSLKSRLVEHQQRRIAAVVSTQAADSAVADDDDEDESAPDEFLTPFFVRLPAGPSQPASRRSVSGGGGSHRPSFSFTPVIASLRSSSPTPSHSSVQVPQIDPSTAASQPIGFLRPQIVEALLLDNAKMVQIGVRPAWSFLPHVEVPAKAPVMPIRRRSSASSRRPSQGLNMTQNNNGASNQQREAAASGTSTPATPGEDVLSMNDVLTELKRMGGGPSTPYAVGFADWVNEEGPEARKEQIDRVARAWKMKGDYADVLGGWRDEMYSIYGPAPAIKDLKREDMSPLPGFNIVFEMERAACALFGFATFGVHCTAYVEDQDGSIRIWVPRRSRTKQTWPGMLDNSVAGGITAGTSARSAMIRECLEEASLEPSFVAPRLRAAGLVSYTYRTAQGWLQPEIQYVYDLKVDADTKLKTNDDEVESFELMDLDRVVQAMFENEFKPNCALVLIDFLVRHGWVSSEMDTRFVEVATRLRRTPVLPCPA